MSTWIKMINDADADPRLAELLFIYRCRNWPESLTDDELARWREHCTKRLLSGQPNAAQQFEQALHGARMSPLATQQTAVLDQLEDYAEQVLQPLNQ